MSLKSSEADNVQQQQQQQQQDDLEQFQMVDDIVQEEAEVDEEEEGRDENVKVMVRCRPALLASQVNASANSKRRQPIISDGNQSVVQVHEDDSSIEVVQSNGMSEEPRQFYFDSVFGPESDNEQVYMRSVRKLVQSAFLGYNCTVFLYGQTGTGKTYTHSSISLSSFAHLFSLIRDSDKRTRFLIRASYFELYNEDIRDLLSSSNKPLELRESKARGVYVRDLSCYLVNNLSELERLKRVGDKKRATAATKMNEHSSRSHSILSLTIETVENNQTESSTGKQSKSSSKSSSARSERQSRQFNEQANLGAGAVRVGRLHLIDLAGSERQSKSGSTGTRLKEASRINLSLTCLSLVIRALTDPSSTHVPYRNSKLTRLLSSSLGGNSKTLLIACISPAKHSLDETLNTLRFASRTKRIKNKARINEDAKDALLRKYRKQIEELRTKLRVQQMASSGLELSEDEALELSLQGGDTSQKTGEQTSGSVQGKHQQQQQQQQQKQQQLQQQQQQVATEELLQQLRLLRGKIMVGGENLLEKAELHEKLLEASRNELEEKRREEERLRERLERKREAIERMTKSKGSLEDQVADLDESIKRALILYKRTKEEQRDQSSEHLQLKESLLQTIRATSKEIKYADCIIKNFIPREHLDLLNTYARYDDESGEWQIKYIALSGNNIAQTRRITEGSKTTTGQVCDDNGYPSETTDGSYSRPDPFVRLKDLAREFLAYATDRKALRTNPTCVSKVQVVADDSDPLVTIQFNNNHKLVLNTKYLESSHIIRLTKQFEEIHKDATEDV